MATKKLTQKQKWAWLKEKIAEDIWWCNKQEKKYHNEGDEKMALAYWSRSYQLDGVLFHMEEIEKC